MKLELKHLAPYLPYRVKVKWFRRDDNSFQTSDLTISDYPFLTKQLFKPILRPLSDLNKPEYESDRDELSEMDMECIENNSLFYSFATEKTLVEHVPYERVQYLLSKHYDIYGLIKEGLAIDINTLE